MGIDRPTLLLPISGAAPSDSAVAAFCIRICGHALTHPELGIPYPISDIHPSRCVTIAGRMWLSQ
jgi:hypothetical protein